MSDATHVISSLRDVPGVQGSFLVSAGGALIARDMASLLTDDLLAEVGPRVIRLAETFASEDARVHSCLIRYPHYMLLLRGTGGGALCVFAANEVNMPALKMGVTLALRRLAPLYEAAPTSVQGPAPLRPPQVPPPRPSSPVVQAVAEPQQQETRPTMRWRGRAVADSE